MAKTETPSFIYDDFTGGELDESRWTYLDIPRGSRARWRCYEPNARTQVGEGTLDIDIRRFPQTHEKVPVFENLKHQLVSTHGFSTDNAPISFALDMAATSIGEAPIDYRDGFASFMVFDEATGWSFRTCSTGKRVFGLYDSLRKTYKAQTFAEVIDAPAPTTTLLGTSRHHEVILDSAEHTVEWWVDQQLAVRVTDADIPADVHISLGLATLSSIDRDRTEGSSRESGLSVSFGPVSVRNGSRDDLYRSAS